MKKIISIFFILLFISTIAFADGMVHYYDDSWKPLKENRQVAAINYENGYENLILTIDIDQETKGEKAVWMFPVPATPDKTVIDIVEGFPPFSGNNINSDYKRNIGAYPIVSFVYSVIPLAGLLLPFAMIGTMSNIEGVAYDGGYYKDVIVHESISKYGVTTELITAENSYLLYGYLKNKGLDLPQSSQDVIFDYIGPDYSFVVSFISSLDKYQEYVNNKSKNNYNYYNGGQVGNLGVFVKFPTDKIYFPLKPTSVYGSTSVPLTLYVTGHVTPKLYPEIAGTKTTYMSSRSKSVGKFEEFYNGTQVNRSGFTKIEMNVPSKYFTQDLWINDSAPVNVGFKGMINSNPLVLGIIFFAIASMLASIGAGLVAFKKKVPNKKLALLGLVNFFTIIGMIIATVLLKTKKIDDKLKEEIKESKLTIVLFDKMKIVYLVVFFVLFIIINFIIANIFLLF
jgi:hypothetical protein